MVIISLHLALNSYTGIIITSSVMVLPWFFIKLRNLLTSSSLLMYKKVWYMHIWFCLYIMFKLLCSGIIVRTIQRLDETCRDVKSAAKTVGDSDLYQKMDKVSSLIKRDIVFAASLYTKWLINLMSAIITKRLRQAYNYCNLSGYLFWLWYSRWYLRARCCNGVFIQSFLVFTDRWAKLTCVRIILVKR